MFFVHYPSGVVVGVVGILNAAIVRMQFGVFHGARSIVAVVVVVVVVVFVVAVR